MQTQIIKKYEKDGSEAIEIVGCVQKNDENEISGKERRNTTVLW